MNRYSERELIVLLKEGDEKAYHTLFHHYYRPLTLFALKYIGDTDEAKEITQDFFVRLWTRHDDLDINISLKAYLYRGIRNACLNYLEAHKVAQKRLKNFSSSSLTNDSPLEKMLVAEQEELLMQVIDALPAKCREIFLLSRVERLSNQAIADNLKISIKTVEGQISKALKRLREIIFLLVSLVVHI